MDDEEITPIDDMLEQEINFSLYILLSNQTGGAKEGME